MASTTAGPPAPADLFRHMARARALEDALAVLWREGRISGELHLGTGEEAVAAGVLAAFRPGDAVALDHRPTPALAVLGVDLVLVVRELLGREDGLCGGRAGRMHLLSPLHRAASSGIVGSSAPLGAGFALAARLLRPGSAAVAFFGDGAMNQGMLLETLNLAIVWSLPLLLVCKDNGWAVTTRREAVTAGDLCARAAAFGMPAVDVDGGDAAAVAAAAARAIERARRGEGPSFLRARVSRLDGHFLGDPLLRAARQPIAEGKELLGAVTGAALSLRGGGLGARAASVAHLLGTLRQARRDARGSAEDPLARARRTLPRGDAQRIEEEAADEVARAVEAALSEGARQAGPAAAPMSAQAGPAQLRGGAPALEPGHVSEGDEVAPERARDPASGGAKGGAVAPIAVGGGPAQRGRATALEPGHVSEGDEVARERARDPASGGGAPTALPSGRGRRPREKTKYGHAIDAAIASAMARDRCVVVLGEDVHALRAPLYARFGGDRVLAAPISEAAFVGAAVGAAMAGLRPVAELMLVDFVGSCLDALLNQASKIEAFSNGRWTVPLVVRAACGGGYGDGGQHEQALWGLLAGIPGLTVVAPSTPADAHGLMLTALEHDGPVVFLEHKLLSEGWLEFLGRAGRDGLDFDVPADGAEGEVIEGALVPFGAAALRRAGRDLTVVSVAVGVHRALAAADLLAREGVECEVLDLRTVRPLDRGAVASSVARTGRLLVVDEDYREFGLSGEVAAAALEAGLAPRYGRVCLEGTIPYARPLEAAALPNVERIVTAVRSLLG